jgi:hypothetical protein
MTNGQHPNHSFYHKMSNVISIEDLLDKILDEYKTLCPQWTRQPDDPRVYIYYISIDPCHYIVLAGWYEKCSNLQIMKRNTTVQHDIMTAMGLYKFTNGIDMWENGTEDDVEDTILFDFNVSTFNGNIDELMLFVKTSVEQLVLLFVV